RAATYAAPTFGDAAAEGCDPGADARDRPARRREPAADRERREDATRPDSATAADESDGDERDEGADRSGDDPEQEALEHRQPHEVAAAGTARAQQREVAPVALRRPECGQVREPERDEGARHGEHDVQRLGVE